MALINCPHCGNTVSNTAETCIHCGKSISSNTEENKAQKPPDYIDLSLSEREKLQEEFQQAYPDQKNYEQRLIKLNKIDNVSTICSFLSAGIIILIYFLAQDEISGFALVGLALGIAMFVISDIIDIALPFLIRKIKKKSLVALKMFQHWLKDKKGIDYQVTFSESDKKWKYYFDGINVIVEGYKG